MTDNRLARQSDVLDIDKVWPDALYEQRQAIGSYVIHGASEYNSRVRSAVTRAINDGSLTDAAALSAFTASEQSFNSYVFHGSPMLPDQLDGGILQPRQAYWSDDEHTVYHDGSPSICFSEDVATAAVRACSEDLPRTIRCSMPMGGLLRGAYGTWSPKMR